jgi:hypothetical protein
MTLEELLARFERPQQSGAGWKALCPAHEDKNPSLSINQKEDLLLLHCHAGCTTGNVCEALGIKLADLSVNGKQARKIANTYDYQDENGVMLFQSVRYEPKSFSQRRPDGKGGWIGNLDGVRRVLYCLPGVASASEVIVCEGEKDVETAWGMDFAATCNPMGAGTGKWKKEYSEALRGKNVTIIADADKAGRDHAQAVATSLHLVAASVKVLEMPSAKDLTEWVERGGTRTALTEIISRAPIWKPAGASTASLGSLSTAELFDSQEEKVEWLAWPFAAVGLSSILDALPKLGKTRFFHEAIRASHESRTFLGHATQAMRVIYVSEQSAASLAMQVREVGFTGLEPVEHLRWFTREHWSRFTYEDFLSSLEETYLNDAGYNCLIIDTWHTVARLENENDAAEVNRLGNLTLNLAARQKLALSMSRHDRKSGGDIGLSGRSSIQLSGLVDVILHLTRLPGQAAPTQRRLQLLGRIPGLPIDQIVELSTNGYVNCGTVEGGIETHRAAETILDRAPTCSEAALPIMKILEGTGLEWTEPVREAVKRLVDKGQLQTCVTRKGKKKFTTYFTGELRLKT